MKEGGARQGWQAWITRYCKLGTIAENANGSCYCRGLFFLNKFKLAKYKMHSNISPKNSICPEKYLPLRLYLVMYRKFTQTYSTQKSLNMSYFEDQYWYTSMILSVQGFIQARNQEFRKGCTHKTKPAQTA